MLWAYRIEYIEYNRGHLVHMEAGKNEEDL